MLSSLCQWPHENLVESHGAWLFLWHFSSPSHSHSVFCVQCMGGGASQLATLYVHFGFGVFKAWWRTSVALPSKHLLLLGHGANRSMHYPSSFFCPPTCGWGYRGSMFLYSDRLLAEDWEWRCCCCGWCCCSMYPTVVWGWTFAVWKKAWVWPLWMRPCGCILETERLKKTS